MPRQYPPEFRERIVALARSGRSVSGLSADYGVADATIDRWLAQDRIDHGEKPGATSIQNTDLAAARKQIRELERELELVRKAAAIFDEQQKIRPKRLYPVIESLTGQGFSEREACRVVGVNRSSYTYWRKRPPNKRELRRAWLGPLVAKIHTDSFGTYGYVRVAAEQRLGHGVIANHKLVYSIVRERGLKGLPKPPTGRRGPVGAFVAADLVRRDFSGDGPNKLWVTDITEHPTTEGKIFCCAVLDAFSRKVVGWSIDSTQTAALVTNALGMAIKGRDPDRTVVHSDRGTQFMSWTFTQRVKEAELMPSVGRTGTALDNAMMESFWGRMQVELLNRRRWKTRVELANAIFEYIESFHNNRRRHSSLNMLTPMEFEELHQ